MTSKATRWLRMLRASGRMAWCVAGAVVAVTVVFFLVDPPTSPLFLASLGGTALFLFGLTQAPAAQPRALFGGHLGGAFIGIACYRLFGDASWVYVLAVASTIVVLLAARAVHPPAGANPLIMVHTHASFSALWDPVAASIAVMALVTVLWSRVGFTSKCWPVKWSDPSPPTVFWGAWDD